MTTLTSGESEQTIDAGLFKQATIGDYVWRDSDADGIQDPTESGINGVTVILKDATGTTVATTVTGVNPTTGAPSVAYGKFHVFLRKENGVWKILTDYDSDEGGKVGEADYKAAAAVDDFSKF